MKRLVSVFTCVTEDFCMTLLTKQNLTDILIIRRAAANYIFIVCSCFFSANQ